MESERINIVQHGGAGLLWLASWLFTIGMLKLGFWQGVAALLIWPYYIGAYLTTVIAP